MKNLSGTEEQIMKYLWRLKKAYMKDLVEEFPEPRPAYTTIATYLTRMTEKGLVGYTQRGKVREYHPAIKKSDYFKGQVNNMIRNFFDNSTSQFASFFTRDTDMTVEQLEELKDLIENQIKEKKK